MLTYDSFLQRRKPCSVDALHLHIQACLFGAIMYCSSHATIYISQKIHSQWVASLKHNKSSVFLRPLDVLLGNPK